MMQKDEAAGNSVNVGLRLTQESSKATYDKP